MAKNRKKKGRANNKKKKAKNCGGAIANTDAGPSPPSDGLFASLGGEGNVTFIPSGPSGTFVDIDFSSGQVVRTGEMSELLDATSRRDGSGGNESSGAKGIGAAMAAMLPAAAAAPPSTGPSVSDIISKALAELSVNVESNGGAPSARKHKRTVSDVLKALPPRPECPICMLTLPIDDAETLFLSCCCKVICYGCELAQTRAQVQQSRCCAFCREPIALTDEEKVARIRSQVARDKEEAMCSLAFLYMDGLRGVKKDQLKAVELYQRATELGHPAAPFQLSKIYFGDYGGDRDQAKAMKYLRLSAERGHAGARFGLGCEAMEGGDCREAVFHWRIAAAAGDGSSLQNLRTACREGLVGKKELMAALRACMAAQNDMNSDERHAAKSYLGR